MVPRGSCRCWITALSAPIQKSSVATTDVTFAPLCAVEKGQSRFVSRPHAQLGFRPGALPGLHAAELLEELAQPSPAGSIGGATQKTDFHLRRGPGLRAVVGGNICLLCATLGTPYLPSFKNRILFLEDLDEAPYRFDRMLTQLLNARLLEQVAGVALGMNKNCKDRKARKGRRIPSHPQGCSAERLLPLKVPVVVGLPFGHVPWNATLPVGVRATLDARRGPRHGRTGGGLMVLKQLTFSNSCPIVSWDTRWPKTSKEGSSPGW